MKYLILNHDDVIIHINNEKVRRQNNGNLLVDEGRLSIAGYLSKEVVEIDESTVSIPEDLAPIKYLYKDAEFVLNPNYVEPKTLKDMESEVEALTTENESLSLQVTDLQLAICDLYELLLGGMM